jgi:transcriptional regulator with XRE-family HTH domain
MVATSIGEKLRKRSTELNLHQIELAERIGVSTVPISHLECDIGVIRASHRADILRFLEQPGCA